MPKKDTEIIVAEPSVKELDPIDVQYQLPLEQQRKLISIPQNVNASDELVRATVELARSARIPLWGVLIVPTKNGNRPYINADGIRFRLANDSREVQSIDPEIIHYPTGIGDTATVKTTVIMKNGQTYASFGSVKVDSQWNEANALLKAETKSERRASYKAIANAVGMPQYDEDAKLEVIDATFKVVNQPPKNVTQLVTWLKNNGISDDLYKQIVGEDISEIEEHKVKAFHQHIVDYQETQNPE